MSLDWTHFTPSASLTTRILAVNLIPLLILAGSLFFLDTYRRQLLEERFKLARIEAQIRRHDLIAPGGDVLCLVSGGADSTCMWHALGERRHGHGQAVQRYGLENRDRRCEQPEQHDRDGPEPAAAQMLPNAFLRFREQQSARQRRVECDDAGRAPMQILDPCFGRTRKQAAHARHGQAAAARAEPTMERFSHPTHWRRGDLRGIADSDNFRCRR